MIFPWLLVIRSNKGGAYYSLRFGNQKTAKVVKEWREQRGDLCLLLLDTEKPKEVEF